MGPFLFPMSEYQAKSAICKTAAEQMNGSGLFAPVGHTAYYSCFLLLEHIWENPMAKTIADLRSLCPDGQNTHERLINEIRDYIRNERNNLRDSNHFYSNMGRLRRLRMSADYDDLPFGRQDAFSSISLMNLTIPILNRYV